MFGNTPATVVNHGVYFSQCVFSEIHPAVHSASTFGTSRPSVHRDRTKKTGTTGGARSRSFKDQTTILNCVFVFPVSNRARAGFDKISGLRTQFNTPHKYSEPAESSVRRKIVIDREHYTIII